MDPMDVEYELPNINDIEAVALLVYNVLFSSNAIPDHIQKESFALYYHQKYGEKNMKDICKAIATTMFKYYYCEWCRDYNQNNIVITYKPIIAGTDGKSMNQYKCLLCQRCNAINQHISNLPTNYKVNILYKEIAPYIYYDIEWCKKCIKEWYRN